MWNDGRSREDVCGMRGKTGAPGLIHSGFGVLESGRKSDDLRPMFIQEVDRHDNQLEQTGTDA